MRKKKPFFKPITSRVNFVEMEEKLLNWWYQSGLVKEYLHRNDKAKVRFSFLDGPITANNPMGAHHAWGRTYKDIWQRFFNMRGFKQRFQNGFDCQGLWVEVEVEKELGFKTRKDIEKYGVARFVNQCKERVHRYAKVQTDQSKRLAYFVDWDNSYYTMSDENNYMIWAFLKKCWQDGNLYKGWDTVPWCPRCSTAISQHEILTEEYQELTHTAVYLRFPIVGKKEEYLLVWTTTPWTIPANALIAANPEIVYALVENEKKKYWLAASLVSRIFGQKAKIVKKVSGSELLEKEKITHYQAPFSDLPAIQKVNKKPNFYTLVLSKELVNEAEGTGLVHISPGTGTEDYRFVVKDLGFQEIVFPAVDESGRYLAGYDWLEGKSAKESPGLILDYLQKKDGGAYLFKTEEYTHRYPVCWRCKTELIWRLVEEWYLAMDDTNKKGAKNYRKQMIEMVKKIHWLPSFGLERELDWLHNMEDWLISKKRYWGLALPVWECDGGHFEVIGSKEELEKKAVKGWEKFKSHTPHRPWIDEVKIKCSSCGKLASRIPDVGNPWLDAGIVSFSTLVDPKTGKVSYLTDKRYWREWFPADFITESFPGQFKNWFYSLIAMATVLENQAPFKAVLGYATLLAEDGRPMHKSWGNAIEFDEAAEKIGVDVMRWMYVIQNPANNLLFGYHLADETRRRFHLTLWNVYNFFVTYANVDYWQPKKSLPSKPTKLDLWILTRLDETLIKATEAMENYNAATAAQALEDFVQDISLWYLRRSRRRVGPTAQDKKDKDLAYAVLYRLLVTLAKVLAVFTPYLAEEIYQNLVNGGKIKVKDSVHLTDWPTARNEKTLDKKLIEQMAMVRKICELGHAARKEARIKVRQPLPQLTVNNCPLSVGEDLGQLIKDELNVKKVVFKKGKGDLGVKLNTKTTPLLKAEGEARELVRQIQELRKETDCKLDQKIVVYGPHLPKKDSLREYVKEETLAKELRPGKELKISSA